MVASVLSLLRLSLGSARDLAPIVVVIAFFQLVILRQPLPDLGSIAVGLVLVTLGLTLFVQGLVKLSGEGLELLCVEPPA